MLPTALRPWEAISSILFSVWVLGTSKAPDGNQVIVQTHSGGPGATAADACSRAGLDLPTFSAPTLQKLQNYHIPALPSPDRAARSMAALVDYAGLRKEIRE